MKRFVLPSLLLIGLAAPAYGLAPGEIWIVANKNSADSRTVAQYYSAKRGVPVANIIYLDLPTSEDISRTAYNDKLLKPLQAALATKKAKVKLLLTTYGVPLRVGPPPANAGEQAELLKIQSQLATLYKQRTDLYAEITRLTPLAAKDSALVPAMNDAKTSYNKVVAQIATLEARVRWLKNTEAVASVDSELSMLWANTYELRLYQPNPKYFRVPALQAAAMTPIVMTCRLDGPSVAIVKGLVDKAIAAEAVGLSGKVYIDARGLKYSATSDPAGSGYNGYDESLRETAAKFSKAGMATALDDKLTLFAPGSCPDAAIYCGWYSHAKYIASNKFVTGAIGYHIASSEAVSLRSPTATFWCKKMLDDGITATLGPVAEPYTFGFPKPAEFFGFLGTGATLSESYWMGNRYTSWMMVLVGDPLYRPFARAPKWAATTVTVSPVGSR